MLFGASGTLSGASGTLFGASGTVFPGPGASSEAPETVPEHPERLRKLRKCFPGSQNSFRAPKIVFAPTPQRGAATSKPRHLTPATVRGKVTPIADEDRGAVRSGVGARQPWK